MSLGSRLQANLRLPAIGQKEEKGLVLFRFVLLPARQKGLL